VVVAIYVVLAVYYYIYKWYKNKRGTDINLGFREIPPE